jgi:plastocyanin
MSRRSTAARVAACTLGLLCAAVGGGAEARDVAGRVVDTAGAPLADAVVFVSSAIAEPAVTARPPATMDQVHKQYVPHVLPIAVGTEVRFPNYDQIHHHVYSFSKAKTFEIPLYKGGPPPALRFDEPGAVVLGCNIHDWMSGVILVLPTTHFAKTDEGGSFVLRDLPEESLEISVWHERSRADPSHSARLVTPSAEASPLTIELAVEAPRQRPAWRGTRTLR